METLFRGCSTLLSKSQLGRRKKKLSEHEKHEVVQYLAKGMKTTNILQQLNRDYRAVKRFESDLEHRRIQKVR